MRCFESRKPWHFIALLICELILSVTACAIEEPQQLTHDGRQKSSPVFRDSGREIVYVDFTDAKLFQLRHLVLANGTDKPLHPEISHAEFEPAWSRDGERYACLKLRGVLSVSILIRDQEGTLLHEILPGGGFNGYRSPTLAPDHSRIAFSYAERGAQQIYTADLKGGDRKALTATSGINNWPAYSPDGRSIVFGSSRDGDFEIYGMNADGSSVRRLTNNSLQDVRPRVSPDGRRIAFTSHRHGNAEIYVMDNDGANQLRLTENPESDDYPDWHPDGQHLVFVREHDGQQNLCLLRLAP